MFKNFWFSYSNILYKEFEKENYTSLLRKIFGILYKFILRFFRHKLSIKSTNLDLIYTEEHFNLELDKLFIKYNCDKGTYCTWDNKKVNTHNYSIFYEKYFLNFKNKEINFLEFGSHEGKGLASFYFYLPQAKFIGVNNNPFQMQYFSKRIQELFVDVSSEKILNNLSKHIKESQDIILDDASHNLRDILITFCIFFKKLRKGGIYVIEDADQFKVFDELNPYKDELTPIEIFNKIKKNKDFESSFINLEDKKYLLNNIFDIKIERGSMIIKGKNISDIIFIYKK